MVKNATTLLNLTYKYGAWNVVNFFEDRANKTKSKNTASPLRPEYICFKNTWIHTAFSWQLKMKITYEIL